MINNLNAIQTMGDQQLRLNSYGYVYLTLNMVNRKRYLGVHKAKNGKFDPSYKGSGKLLKQAIEKYGWDKFKTKPIKWCSTPEELYKTEHDLIEKYDCIQSDRYYNVHEGGKGGKTWANYLDDNKRSLVCNKIGLSKSNRPRTEKELESLNKLHEYNTGKHHTRESKLKNRLSNIGQKRSDLAKQHMSENHADVSGDKNPCYGKICINNGLVNKFIKPNELDSYRMLGYTRGMIANHQKKQ